MTLDWYGIDQYVSFLSCLGVDISNRCNKISMSDRLFFTFSAWHFWCKSTKVVQGFLLRTRTSNCIKFYNMARYWKNENFCQNSQGEMEVMIQSLMYTYVGEILTDGCILYILRDVACFSFTTLTKLKLEYG